ncbi:hypothetical protein GQ600_17071 [Phytophthora cactorum]|nr:hypothetical protein GQ600_17071 [Phytophthora cactorum]
MLASWVDTSSKLTASFGDKLNRLRCRHPYCNLRKACIADDPVDWLFERLPSFQIAEPHRHLGQTAGGKSN